MENNLCIIPARGGSKRIPRKNIREFLGKPIIAYSIESALKSDLFTQVMVSTDDEEIADVAMHYGASVPFKRSDSAATDYATTADVLLEVLYKYEETGQDFENLCCIYPCAPFVTPEDLRKSYYQLQQEALDGVASVVPLGFPIQRVLKIQGNLLSFLYPEYAMARSQDLETAYQDAGQYYWLKIEAFKKHKKMFPEKCGGSIIREFEAQDIDDENDWKLAEMKYQILER